LIQSVLHFTVPNSLDQVGRPQCVLFDEEGDDFQSQFTGVVYLQPGDALHTVSALFFGRYLPVAVRNEDD
jgi:hypothetical protein